MICDAGDHVAGRETGQSRRAAGKCLGNRESRTGYYRRIKGRLAEGDSQHAVLNFAALLECVDDAAGGSANWNCVSGRLLVAGDCSSGRCESDQFSVEIYKCSARSAEAKLGVGTGTTVKVTWPVYEQPVVALMPVTV